MLGQQPREICFGRQKGGKNSLFIVHFFGEVEGAVFISKTNRSTQKYGHRLVGWRSGDVSLNSHVAELPQKREGETERTTE